MENRTQLKEGARTACPSWLTPWNKRAASRPIFCITAVSPANTHMAAATRFAGSGSSCLAFASFTQMSDLLATLRFGGVGVEVDLIAEQALQNLEGMAAQIHIAPL